MTMATVISCYEATPLTSTRENKSRLPILSFFNAVSIDGVWQLSQLRLFYAANQWTGEFPPHHTSDLGDEIRKEMAHRR